MSTPLSSPPEPAIQGAARLLAEGRPVEAAERLGALVAEAPTYAAAHVLRATALEAAGRVDEAIVSWGRAAALVPRSPLVHRERERLLATRLADDLPPDLPPAVPDPDAPSADALDEAPEAEAPDVFGLESTEGEDLPPDDLADFDGPLLDFGAPRRLEASDLVFLDTAPAGPEQTPEAPADEPPAEPSGSASAPLSPASADWGTDETGIAPVLPPDEGDAVPPPGLPERPATAPADEWDDGWDLLGEDDVPTPPPGAYAEPDVVAPEGPVTGPPVDAFAEVDEADAFAEVDVPEEPPVPAGPSVADELDALIAQLEDAPRIKPDPEYRGPEVSLDHSEVDDMASETLAKIYAAQHQYVEAAIVYEKLAARQPEQADALLERAAELRQRGG